MAKEYVITFTRYGRDREMAAPVFVYTDTFTEAFENAALILKGMQSADPDREYGIASIGGAHTMRGAQHNEYAGNIWRSHCSSCGGEIRHSEGRCDECGTGPTDDTVD